jgi:hypothetical protein
VKDAFNDYLIHGQHEAVSSEGIGTKVAPYFYAQVPPGDSVEIRLRLTKTENDLPESRGALGQAFDDIFNERIVEADAFYVGLARPEDAQVLRQAAAGLIWSKQVYYYIVDEWLRGDPLMSPPPGHQWGRNRDWHNVYARDVISMPDKWEFPWFAAWDLAFHTVPFAILDPDFAKDQLVLMLREWYMNPNGQLAAYEYNFGDVNPPVHAWACRVLHESSLEPLAPDLQFLERVFTKLAINFTWWVNRKDMEGNNLFAGGFLGLDNIGVFDRSMQLPEGLTLEQADGTAWMAMFCLEMFRMSLDLASNDPAWEDSAVKFFDHFVAIQKAINSIDGSGLWDEQEGFYLDHIRAGDQSMPLRVRSVVGMLPMLAAVTIDEKTQQQLRGLGSRIQWFLNNRPEMRESFRFIERPGVDGEADTVRKALVALPSHEQLARMLATLFNEDEFLSPYGIRSLSKYHKDNPYVLDARGQHMTVSYLPGEADTTMFGGNSNWRGPIWFPINTLILEALGVYYQFYGNEFKVEFPTGSGNWVNLLEARNLLADRLVSIFRPDDSGQRPVHGGVERYATDPNWRDLILFNEYFDADTGRGCGASHQTGWTGLVAVLAWVLKHRPAGRQ